MSLLSAFPVLNPSGTIALAERGLMIHAIEFMLIVAVPVYILLFFFAWKYRSGNTKSKYMPDWEHAKMDELIWWAIPLEIVLVLGALTWTSTHQLDPKKPLDTTAAPMVIEVVAMQWKWLFIYPEQNIATINYLQIPTNRPIRFEVTADAPMNSFWIPQLGGQIYAMTGMVNDLNLMATEPGKYAGGSSNYSGDGFASMKFVAEAVPQESFDAWVTSVKASSSILTKSEYDTLSKPSTPKTPLLYAEVEKNLYNVVVMQFMDMNSAEKSSAGAVSHHGDASANDFSALQTQ